jgi:hypothetical protein
MNRDVRSSTLAYRGRRYIGDSCEIPLVTLRETVTIRWASPNIGGVAADASEATAHVLNGDGRQTCARCPARSFPMSKGCYSLLKPFKLRQAQGLAYSRPSFLLRNGEDSSNPATVLHLFDHLKTTPASALTQDDWDKPFEDENKIMGSSLCKFPEGFDSTGYGPGYATSTGADDKLAHWVDKERGELWKARSDASRVHTTAELLLKPDKTQLVHLSAGAAFESVIADLGIVPFFPANIGPNPNFFGVDHGIQASDVAAPLSRLREICLNIQAQAPNANNLADFALQRMPFTKARTASSCLPITPLTLRKQT